MVTRPPIITILGHVDHGKTTLLDKIRSSHVAAKESGGITQHIAAYQVEYQGRRLTFVDTPGHAAFSAMRKRGGLIADIAILVVAADDGIMPQTRESIEHIKVAKIPFIVAVNKIDLEGVNIQKIKTQLAEMGEYVEGFGGNIPFVEISAKTGKNLDTLLETLILLADIQELKDNSEEIPTAVVIESKTDPRKGPLATLIVKSGIFYGKQALYQSSGESIGKIRALFDFQGQEITQAPPSTPIQIIGFEKPLNVGDIITTDPCFQLDISFCQPLSCISSKSADTCLNLIIKTDVLGSLEAIFSSLPEGVNLISSGAGQVTESDIHLAQAENALIICFNTKADSSIKKLAQVESVQIISFKIIYELLDYLVDTLKKRQLIQSQAIEIGQVKIIRVFCFDDKTVYGCVVISGKFRLGDLVESAKIVSLQIGKKPINEVKKGEEFGLILDPQLDFKEGDVIKSHSN